MSQILHISKMFDITAGQLIEYECKIGGVKVIGVEYESGAVPQDMQAVISISIYDIPAPQEPVSPGKTWEQGGNLVYENVGDIKPSAIQMFPIANGENFLFEFKIAGQIVYTREVENVAIANFGSVAVNVHVHDNAEVE